MNVMKRRIVRYSMPPFLYDNRMNHERMGGPLVLKVGGSLLDCLPRILHELNDSGRTALVVPGGGPFADLVRRLKTGEEEAHWMAVAAMDQYGWYIASFGIPAVEALEIPHETRVLLPYRLMRERDPLPHTWRVTSDTISAWVAWELKLELVLLKSVDGIVRGGHLLTRVQDPVEAEEVDSAFIPYVLEHRVNATLLNARKEGRLQAFLSGDPVPCTRIYPRF